MWSNIQERNPVWYFDATSNVLKNIENQKQPYYYSIVCYDKATKSIIPIAEFSTTSQTQLSISKYLFSIKKLIEGNIGKKKFACAPIMVMDNSWTLINSIMEIFNNCKVSQYINWSFEILIKKQDNVHLWLIASRTSRNKSNR